MTNWDIHKKDFEFDASLTSHFRAVVENRVALRGIEFSTSKYLPACDILIPPDES